MEVFVAILIPVDYQNISARIEALHFGQSSNCLGGYE